MGVLGAESCCDPFQLLRPSSMATEGLKRDLRDEVEFRQARLTVQGKKLREGIDMYGRDAIACLRDGNESLARQFVSQKVAMQNRLANISTQWGVLESVRTSLRPGSRRYIEDVETCRLILAKAQASGDIAVRRPGEQDVDDVDDADVDRETARLREVAKKNPRSASRAALLSPVGGVAAHDPHKPSVATKTNLLIDLQSRSDGEASMSGDSATLSDDQILCTGEGDRGSAGSSSSRSYTPPSTPPRSELVPLGHKAD